ncbi:WD40 repeat-like protein [Venturia nashicola]|uniref:Protein transport protein SEC31 n=1 Tax=Venturia nashicola TaxID=86259 RepID=A0A4Z1P641_9PEZI|nr:WD40 repeat-like protein [Venturia nashicola]
MVRIREISRTAVFAWSPSATAPSIATGTKAGAVDADFSNENQLELWDLDIGNQQQGIESDPAATISVDSSFYDIAWGQPLAGYSNGIIAGGLESGSLDLWDASKLRTDSSNAHISRITKHTGPIKSLDFNLTDHKILATAGAKAELYIHDVTNSAAAFRLGTAAARADDYDAVGWNKKVAHILATGSSGGLATVWDMRGKKEVRTLTNNGRKLSAVSAIAWSPEQSTKLATATSSDQEPRVLLWDLRNPVVPEITLRGHEQGILSLAWNEQDPNLLVSCGKDNRTICWNVKTGESFGEYPIVTNWTFQSKWSPRQPGLLATASFDGKIGVQTIQNTNADTSNVVATPSLDDADFFAQAGNQPTGKAFSLPVAPKWLERPISASFGFGGKLIIVAPKDATSRASKVSIESFVVDDSIGEAANKFEEILQKDDMTTYCESKIAGAKTEEEKADWTVIETLISGSRKGLRDYLGFTPAEPEANGETTTKANGFTDDDDAGFFGGDSAEDSFLSTLASTKGAKTNNPFKIYSGSETDADKSITKALMLGNFEQALDVCLQEDRISDAFMIAICGGNKCIEKAQNAYFKRKEEGPNYLRLLASVVGKNLWDVVYNADLSDWKEVLATLCTFADEKEFPDLCEALGDRLEETVEEGSNPAITRKDASFCYLAGSKLEKVVGNWTQELQESEKVALQEGQGDSAFSIHARVLQDFVEKVTVFRQVTKFTDPDATKSEGWKLEPLYAKYTEYAEILASHGKLQIAERYLNLLPAQYSAADAAKTRVKQATQKATATAATQRQMTAATTGAAQRGQRVVPAYAPTQQRTPAVPAPSTGFGNPYAPANTPASAQPPGTRNSYAPTGFQQPQQSTYQPPQQQNAYAPQGYQVPQSQAPTPYGGYQQPHSAVPPPPKSTTSPLPVPAALRSSIPDWNDTPDFGSKPISRRATPAMVGAPVTSPYAGTPGGVAPPPPAPYSAQQRGTPPVGPPPKAGAPRLMSPPPQLQDNRRPSSSAANAYAPAPAAQAQPFPAPQQHLPPRVSSPYTPPVGSAPSNSRYAPAPGSQPAPVQQGYGGPGGRPIAPPPSASSYAQSPYGQVTGPSGPPPPVARAPPPASQAAPPPPPKGGPVAPPPAGPPRAKQRGSSQATNVQLPPPQRSNSRPPTAESEGPPAPKYPPGDRSHIPPESQQIFQLLSSEMARIKSKAPAQFRPQVLDTEKRLSILFDHLNNEDLLKPGTIAEMTELSQFIQGRKFEPAQALFTDIMTSKTDEGSNWMVGVKRLIQMSRATPV